MAFSQGNATAKNTRNAGNTVEFFRELKNIVSVNDGKHQCGNFVLNCFNHSAPFDFITQTDILITSNKWDVMNLRKTFLNAKLRFDISLTNMTNPWGAWNDVDHLGKLFIGYKASAQAVRELQLYANNAPTKYHTKWVVQESFAYHTLKSWTMRDKKRYIHTLYENAKGYMPDICGTYINIVDFIDGQPHPVEFEINIPIVDFLGLQGFNKWVKEFGELYLELWLTHGSLVVCTCDPRDVFDVKRYLETDDLQTASHDSLTGTPYDYEHRFTQMEDEFTSFGFIEYDEPTHITKFGCDRLRCHVHQSQCLELTSTIRGYNITTQAKTEILQMVASEKLVIPAQELVFNTFPAGADENGITTNINITYQNITNVSIVFPKTTHQITCFENPMFDELQLVIGGQYYPNKKFSTYGARYLQEQLIVADLDGSLQATKEYTESIVNVRNDPVSGNRWKNSLADDTSFIAIFETERGDGGYVFDGLESGGANVNTEITGKSKYTDFNNTYYYCYTSINGNVDPTRHPPRPQCWLCMDTFFVVHSAGISYINTESPRGSQSGSQ